MSEELIVQILNGLGEIKGRLGAIETKIDNTSRIADDHENRLRFIESRPDYINRKANTGIFVGIAAFLAATAEFIRAFLSRG